MMHDQQFITDPQGNRIGILLSMEDYNKLLEAWEELEDIRDYDMAKAKKSDTIPAEEAFKEIEERRNKKKKK